MLKKTKNLFFVLIVFTGCLLAVWRLIVQPSAQSDDLSSKTPLVFSASDEHYYKTIQPIFNNRCVVCHGCYSSPCQFNMQGPEGIARGAHSGPDVYNPSRLDPIIPSRLSFDAQTTQEWQSPPFEFYDVFKNGVFRSVISFADPAAQNPKLLTLPRLEHASRVCPKNEKEVGRYLNKFPDGQMPYGLTPLSGRESELLSKWLDQGADLPQPIRDLSTSLHLNRVPPEKHSAVIKQVKNWNQFFNKTSNDSGETKKFKLVSRYLYEHLFLAHLFFKEAPDMFFRVVRSTTMCESGVTEFNARRPNELPEKLKNISEFYYCLVPMNLAIVEKNHMPYLLSSKKMERFQSLFFAAERPWKVDTLPSYNIAESSNPFKTFRNIPAFARYQFLLDDAEYHVSTFIKGPVCYGNGAINVIQEQSYIVFMDPNSDPLARPSSDPDHPNVPFYDQASEFLDQPAKWADSVAKGTAIERGLNKISNTISGVRELGSASLKFKSARIQEVRKYKNNRGFGIIDIWSGEERGVDGFNENAILTVFRNSESASVLKGARGDISKTLNVLDYAIFERIVYDLVVNFNVFDSIELQALTRIYKGFLRMDQEDMFLYFLPLKHRNALRRDWYRGIDPDAILRANLFYGNLNEFPESQVAYSPPSLQDVQVAKKELVEKILFERLNYVTAKIPDWMNWKTFLHRKNPQIQLSAEEQTLSQIAGIRAEQEPFSLFFPDHSMLVLLDANNKPASVYSILRNKETLSPMFLSQPTLANHENSLVVMRNLGAFYPNLFFRIKQSDLTAWVQCIRQLKPQFSEEEDLAKRSQATWLQLLKCGGIPKNHPDFWQASDEIHYVLKKEMGNKVGILDLSRYGFPDSVEVH
jgi:hypothetical protein